jgi:FkbM family methyltransferase
MFKIGKRDFSTFIKRIFKIENYLAIIRFFSIHKKPLKRIVNEILSSGTYPKSLRFNTPTGTHQTRLYSPDDFSTFNLIFCRKDYLHKNKHKVILDIGSNIGISAIYWLTRNNKTIVYCYEPSSDNYQKLKKNLIQFEGRFFLYKKAVSSTSFVTYLNLDKSGVYNTINNNQKVNFLKKEKCDVLSINNCIEDIIKKHGKIDMIKIDNEGEELKTVASIDKKFWNIINCLNVDGESVKELVPKIFHYSKVGSAQRFLKNDK